MISKEQAKVLRYVADNEPVNGAVMVGKFGSMGVMLDTVDLLSRFGNGYVITDTGRLALEEYENFQEQGRLLAEWSHAEANEEEHIDNALRQIIKGLNLEVLRKIDHDTFASRELFYAENQFTIDDLLESGHLHYWTVDGKKRYTLTDAGRVAIKYHDDLQADSSARATAKIAALEAENAALRGLLAKAIDAIAPIEMSCFDADIIMSKPDDPLWISFNGNIDNDVVAIRFNLMDDDKEDVLRVSHLRNAASIALLIRAALDPTTPYEDTPDGSDLLARDTEADDDE